MLPAYSYPARSYPTYSWPSYPPYAISAEATLTCQAEAGVVDTIPSESTVVMQAEAVLHDITPIDATVRVRELGLSTLVDGLVGRWPLTEASYQGGVFVDYSGEGNDGTPTNTPVFEADQWGRANSAMVFNGVDDNVVVSHNTSIDFAADESFTITYWINLPPLGSNPKWWIGKGNPYNEPGNGYGFSAWDSANNPIKPAFYYNDGGTRKLRYFSALYRETWYHLAVVFDRGVGKLTSYVDGVKQGTYTDISGVGSLENAYDLDLGKGNIVNHFTGSLDNVRFYSRALTQPEITALYTQYSALHDTIPVDATVEAEADCPITDTIPSDATVTVQASASIFDTIPVDAIAEAEAEASLVDTIPSDATVEAEASATVHDVLTALAELVMQAETVLYDTIPADATVEAEASASITETIAALATIEIEVAGYLVDTLSAEATVEVNAEAEMVLRRIAEILEYLSLITIEIDELSKIYASMVETSPIP